VLHFAGHGAADATHDPLPDVQVLIGLLEDAITKLAVVRDSVVAYGEVVEEIDRLRTRMYKLTAIVFDRPEE